MNIVTNILCLDSHFYLEAYIKERNLEEKFINSIYMEIKKLFFLFSILYCFILNGQAQTYNTKSTIKKIEHYLEQLESKGFSGSVLVDIEGEKVWSKGYGWSDEEKQIFGQWVDAGCPAGDPAELPEPRRDDPLSR